MKINGCDGVEVYYGRVKKVGSVGELMTLPVVTVVVRLNEDGTVNRGISVCSVDECPSKQIGKTLAMKRLVATEKAKMNIQPINSGFSRVRSGEDYPEDFPQFNFKGEYHAEINQIERELFELNK